MNIRTIIPNVRAICSRLGLPSQVLMSLENDVIFDWEACSSQHKALLVIARALIANPEVLLMHTPTATLDDRLAKRTLETLRAFVDDRGLENHETEIEHRRPRTLIFTTYRAEVRNYVDAAYHIVSDGS